MAPLQHIPDCASHAGTQRGTPQAVRASARLRARREDSRCAYGRIASARRGLPSCYSAVTVRGDILGDSGTARWLRCIFNRRHLSRHHDVVGRCAGGLQAQRRLKNLARRYAQTAWTVHSPSAEPIGRFATNPGSQVTGFTWWQNHTRIEGVRCSEKSAMLERRNCGNSECMIHSRARHKVCRRIGGSQGLTVER